MFVIYLLCGFPSSYKRGLAHTLLGLGREEQNLYKCFASSKLIVECVSCAVRQGLCFEKYFFVHAQLFLPILEV